MVYKWGHGSHHGGLKAQEVGEYLNDLREKNGGSLKPAVVVRDAKYKRSPLHDYFEWDDSAAAASFREEQARRIIRAVVVEVETSDEEPRQVRAYLAVDNTKGKKYVTVQDALSDPELRAEVLDRAMRELQSWKQRYQDLKELAPFFKLIDAA